MSNETVTVPVPWLIDCSGVSLREPPAPQAHPAPQPTGDGDQFAAIQAGTRRPGAKLERLETERNLARARGAF